MPVPADLFSLAALHIDIGGDLHACPGVHLRWAALPELGLPSAPIEIARKPVGSFEQGCTGKPPIAWTRGGRGRVLTPPIVLRAKEIAYGLISPPAGDRCLAARVLTTGITADRITAGYRDAHRFVPVTAASDSGYLIGAGIEVIRVVGPGTITDARWFPLSCAGALEGFTLVGHAGPPFPALAHYDPFPLADPAADAVTRVLQGAPLRVSLADAVGAAGPTSITPGAATPADEVTRVLTLADTRFQARFRRLLDDTSDVPSRLVSAEAIRNEGATSDAGTAAVPLLFFLFGALRDPSLARWAGFSFVDRPPPGSPAYLYRVRAVFDPRTADRNADRFRRHESFLAGYRADTRGLATHRDARSVVLDAYSLVVPAWRPPRVASVSSVGGARDERWISGGDELLRAARIPFLPASADASYALYRRDPATGVVTAMNPSFGRTRYRLPLGPAEDAESANPDWRWFSDGAAPAEAVSYGIAAADAFGRWSAWREIPLGPGLLVRPPTPVPEPFYLGAARDPVDDAPRAGEVRVRVRLPDRAPPGVPTLTDVEIRLVGNDDAVLATRLLSVPATGAGEIDVRLPGPPLGRAEVRRLNVDARFFAGALVSEMGRAPVTAADPRPPATLALVPAVHWSARPDARDSSLLRLEWRAAAGHAGYRVYQASTRTLENHLRSLGGAGRAAIAAVESRSMSASEIAAALAPMAGSFPRAAFALAARQLVAPDPDGACRFETFLPGRSRLVYLFRVSAVAGSGIEEDWVTSAPAYFWAAVPRSVRLQPPLLEAESARGAGEADACQLTVTLGHGQRAAALRIFRTAAAANARPGKMALVYEAPIARPPGEEVGGPSEDGADVGETSAIRPPWARIEYVDRGPTRTTPGAQLAPWVRYVYRAQIQSSAVAGEPPGIWSDFSPMASVTLVPAAGPPRPVLSAHRTAEGVDLSWECAALRALTTSLGDFRFRIMRIRASETFPVEVVTIRAMEPRLYRDTHAGPSRARYWVETVDPVGRRQPSSVVEVV